MRTAAVLPVKRFEHAKQRLGASVADPLRVALAGAMVADVLAALAATGGIERTIVVTSEPTVARAAGELGATVLADAAESGQPAAVRLGVAHARAEGFERVLCVPGDCPALDPAELDALLATPPASEPEVVILPDRHGSGTNGLLLTPGDAIPPAFGPGSCERHRALALAAGAACRVERLPSLLLDVDTGADLAALRARLASHAGRAARTREVLGRSAGADAGAVSVTSTA
jgi:2-phospho-L-lactate/phosphoenolpyruvate guanylyltransferase